MAMLNNQRVTSKLIIKQRHCVETAQMLPACWESLNHQNDHWMVSLYTSEHTLCLSLSENKVRKNVDGHHVPK